MFRKSLNGFVLAQVLWGEERAAKGVTAKQSFVDLGCGNGLLVHILSNEGVNYITLHSFVQCVYPKRLTIQENTCFRTFYFLRYKTFAP